jgi:hypothetical protein
MDKIGGSSADLWLPYLLMALLVATGVISTPRGPTAVRPGVSDPVSGQTAREWQNIAARLWQDPLEATESVRKAVANHDTASATVRDVIPLEQLIAEHSYDDGKGPDGTIDYVTNRHRVLYLFVSLPSDAYPEASEQRIRERVAIVSALSTAGYRPANAARLGVARWDANLVANESSKTPPITSQLGYPFETFVLDGERKVLFKENLARKFDEVIVFYVEEASLQIEKQFEWLKRLSKTLASSSPPDRFAKKEFILSRWIGPNTSERMVALLRAAGRDLAKRPPDAPTAPMEALPINVVSVLPTIEAAFTSKLVRSSAGDDESLKLLANESPLCLRPRFVDALEKNPREIPLAECDDAASSGARPWITLERLGCDDALLAAALVRELKLRRPKLFDIDKPVGTVALVSEWDTLYGRALPQSFEDQFVKAGGHKESVRHFTYLRGLDGQVAGVAEKPKTDGGVRASDSTDVLRQLMKSRAPSISFGRTQVDYVDRLAAKLQISQRTKPNERLEAVGILGSDTYDKLLILQGLRKVFPSAEYFTTDLDASLFAPEQYDVTRNLLVATAFDLEVTEAYQKSILPFRDSAQTSIYFATLHATEYFNMKKNRDIGKPFRSWVPAIFEIGRSGPYRLVSNPPVHDAIEQKADPPAGATSDETVIFRCPLPAISQSARCTWRHEIVPLAALAVIIAAGLTHFGREACRRVMSLTKLTARQFARLARSHHKLTIWRRLGRELRGEIATWLLIVAALFFLAVAARMPWIAEKSGQEPFLVFEGISSWPTTWLRALALFLCACYFWIIALQFRRALAGGHRELARTAPEGCPPSEVPSRSTPCQAWDRFCRRSRSWKIKALILGIWAVYVCSAVLLFSRLDPPALVTRGQLSMNWEKAILLSAVFSMNLLIVYAVVHNFSCAVFVRQVSEWLRQPDAPETDCPPLHTALMRTIGLAAGAMTQMIYYPFTLIFLLIAARHPLFDNFDWPIGLIIVFLFSCTALLSSTLLVRRSADQARKNALAWLGRRIAILKWQSTGTSGALPQKHETALARAEWQLGQIQQVGGAALSEGFLSNPLLRAVLIPIGGTGVLQLIDVAGKAL